MKVLSGCAGFLGLVAAGGVGAIGYAWWTSDDTRNITGSMVEGFRRQNELTVFVSQVVAVPTTQEAGPFNIYERSQTTIQPEQVRYTVDLSSLTDKNITWDASAHKITVIVPPVIVQPPQLDATRKRVFRTGPPATAATWDRFDRSNAVKAVREGIRLASAPDLMRMAEASARGAIAHNAELFLTGAKIQDATVVVRFATEGGPAGGSHWDVSRSVKDVLHRS